ncbi:hypothetical protein EE612_012395 [Oryza sativa]|jgi:hypothetical protein|nr:hypothetical protein EE612_012395 [Oryza sativa]
MAPASKAERKAVLDAGAWMFNVVTSVGIIMVNKALMATHGFSFGKTCYNSSLVVELSRMPCPHVLWIVGLNRTIVVQQTSQIFCANDVFHCVFVQLQH